MLHAPDAAMAKLESVVSRINRRANVGHVAHLSGTVGAAMEAVYVGVPGLYRLRRKRRSDFTSGTDSHAYAEGLITITPLRFDWTAEAMLSTIDR